MVRETGKLHCTVRRAHSSADSWSDSWCFILRLLFMLDFPLVKRNLAKGESTITTTTTTTTTTAREMAEEIMVSQLLASSSPSHLWYQSIKVSLDGLISVGEVVIMGV